MQKHMKNGRKRKIEKEFMKTKNNQNATCLTHVRNTVHIHEHHPTD